MVLIFDYDGTLHNTKHIYGCAFRSAYDMLVKEGYAEERVYTDENAMTTLDNAVNTFTILKNQGVDTITIVTSSYHQRRANILYETLAEIVRKTEGVSITVAGNYSCEAQA